MFNYEKILRRRFLQIDGNGATDICNLGYTLKTNVNVAMLLLKTYFVQYQLFYSILFNIKYQI